uniref:Uncharacterized protein n=1 Tax=Arundo donax TaxID=35708 RepID=A0A0A8Y3H7_ARUDO
MWAISGTNLCFKKRTTSDYDAKQSNIFALDI